MPSLLARVASTVSARLGRESPLVRALRPAYERLLEVATLGHGTEWSVNGEVFRIDPRMRRFLPPETEPELWALLRGMVGPRDVVLDIGSFLGVYGMAMARWGARVFAFEPTPAVARTLRRHVELNGLSDRVTVNEVALGAAPGSVTFHQHDEPYRNAVSAHDPKGAPRGTVEVQMTTVDEFCRARALRPTLIRMDVQGLEAEVLRGARQTLAACRDGFRAVVEVHPQLWGAHGLTPASFDALLAELGLRARPVTASEPLYTPDGHVILEPA
ncbi:MAG TPA: FkbM family methyltransferase [Myxococcaceae bacterium]|jgi:FkbM family methyltransferase